MSYEDLDAIPDPDIEIIERRYAQLDEREAMLDQQFAKLTEERASFAGQVLAQLGQLPPAMTAAAKAGVEGTAQSLAQAAQEGRSAEVETLQAGLESLVDRLSGWLAEAKPVVNVEAAQVDLSEVGAGLSALADVAPPVVNVSVTLGAELAPVLTDVVSGVFDRWMPEVLKTMTVISKMPKRKIKFTAFDRNGEPTEAEIA